LSGSRDLPRRRRRLALTGLLIIGCATISAHAADEVLFEIPSQSLSSALNTFARQAGLQIFFPTGAIAGRSAPAIRGRLSARAALQKLIDHSELEVVSDDGTTVILRVIAGARILSAGDRVRAGDKDAATVLEEVIVRGSPREGTLKRNSDTVVSTITELEIKKLPTFDVSDALARLPGVRRNDTQSGENRYVSIRGLNNAAASQSIDGVLLTNYVNRSRATSTELLPAGFFKSVVVTTTVTPDLDENANAAHVALAAISGFDTDGQRVLEVRGLRGSNNRSDGVVDTHRPLRFSGTWRGPVNAENRIGLAVGAVIDRLGSRQDATSIDAYQVSNGSLIPYGALTKGATYTNTQRAAAMLRLDYKRDDSLSVFGEYFYMTHDYRTDQRTSTVSVSAVNGELEASSARFGFNRSSSPDIRDNILQAGADVTLSPLDEISLRLGATYNHVDASGVSTSGFSLAQGSFAAPIDYHFGHDSIGLFSGATADLSQYLLSGKVTVNDSVSRDQNYFGRVDYAHNLGPAREGLGLKFGIQWKALNRRNRQLGYARILSPGQTLALADVAAASRTTLFEPVNWNEGLLISELDERGIPAPQGVYTADPADGYGQDFTGAEQIADFYSITSYKFTRARVSVGFRAAHTHRDLDQFEPDAQGIWESAHYEQSYRHFLPSTYGSFDVTSHLKLRAAFSETLERPAINSSSRRLITSYDTPVTRSVSYSNPYLLPIQSTNFDVSAEYYYGPYDAHLSFGVFSKYLRDIPAVSSSQSVGADGVREIVSYTNNLREVNGRKVYGRSRGVEWVWSDPQLGFFPARLGSLGVTLAYDYIAYQATAVNGGSGVPSTDTRLVDAAPRSFFSASVSYHAWPFAANLSVQRQSSIPTLSYNPDNDRRETYVALLDAQVSYALDSNIRIVMEGRNLLDQDIVDRYAVTGYGPAYQVRNNGRTLWLGGEITLF
jgi:iron complex outermembrane receptor protein